MEINLDAKAVEQAVTDAIVNSAIGAKIKMAVNELLSKGYDNPIQKAIGDVIVQQALAIVRDEYKDQIAAAVREQLTDECIKEFVSNCIHEITSKKYR